MVVVPVGGLEPPRHRWRRILNPLRLPIPSHRRMQDVLYTKSNCFARVIFMAQDLAGVNIGLHKAKQLSVTQFLYHHTAEKCGGALMQIESRLTTFTYI